MTTERELIAIRSQFDQIARLVAPAARSGETTVETVQRLCHIGWNVPAHDPDAEEPR